LKLSESFAKRLLSQEGIQSGFVYLGIAFTVILFNLKAIFGLDILLGDDPIMYTEVLNGKFPWWMMKFSLLSPFTEWLAWNLMVYSLNLARFLYTVFLMVPISCCFYYFLKNRFGFSRMTAFTAAVLPNILPMQRQIPAGINMSYVLWGLLPALVSLIIGFQYLEKETSKNWIRLAAASLCFFISTQLMEQALFLLPSFGLAFWGYKKFARKSILLMSLFTLTAIPQLIRAIINPRNSAKVYFIPLNEIVNRFLFYFQWSLPFPNISPEYIVLIFSVLISTGFILFLKQSDNTFFTQRLFLYIFFIAWAVFNIFAFIFISPFYTPRLVYISSFGLNAIFVFSIYIILYSFSRTKFKLHIPVFIIVIIFSGVLRYYNLDKMYSLINIDFSIIRNELAKKEFPPHSQIVIFGVKGISNADNKEYIEYQWKLSSGLLKYALKRKDISGFFYTPSAEYFNYKNYFEIGLSMSQPVFLFGIDKKNGQLQQFEYALQWRGETMDAPWTILQADKTTGTLFPIFSGVSMKEYELTILALQNKGIHQSNILWGGLPTAEERIRLKYTKQTTSETKKNEQYEVLNGEMEIGGIGYVLKADSTHFQAMRETHKKYTDKAVFKVKLKAHQLTGKRNGFIQAFTSAGKTIEVGVWIGARTYQLGGNVVKVQTKKYVDLNTNGIFYIVLEIDLKEQVVTATINGMILRSKLIKPISEIEYVGYVGYETQTEFTEIEEALSL